MNSEELSSLIKEHKESGEAWIHVKRILKTYPSGGEGNLYINSQSFFIPCAISIDILKIVEIHYRARHEHTGHQLKTMGVELTAPSR